MLLRETLCSNWNTAYLVKKFSHRTTVLTNYLKCLNKYKSNIKQDLNHRKMECNKKSELVRTNSKNLLKHLYEIIWQYLILLMNFRRQWTKSSLFNRRGKGRSTKIYIKNLEQRLASTDRKYLFPYCLFHYIKYPISQQSWRDPPTFQLP